MLSLTFNIDLKNNHMLQFTRKAIFAHMIVKSKYEDTWNVGILFDYWRGKGSNRNLTNIELQTKLTSILMIICQLRPAEIKAISLRHLVISEQSDKVDLRLQPKTKSGFHLHKLPKTRNQTVYSFRHSAAIQQVVMDLDETILNTYTGCALNSKLTNEYCVFAERLKNYEMATKLSDTRGQMECNPISMDHWQLEDVQQYATTSLWFHLSA
ncbi:MAG: hypothetical protein EZS28_023511, partial [Streblomastix strix]